MPETQSGLTYTTSPITTTSNGQVIENLEIWVANGDAITVNHDNVTIRNVIIHNATGNGIAAEGVSNLTVSDSLIVNSAQPTGNGGGDPVNGAPGIFAVEVNGLKVDHVTFQGSEVGIYAGQSPGTQLSYIEGYNMQGPFPAGQLVQFVGSPNSTLTHFYNYNDPNNSHPEDNISVIDSPNTVISHGVIDGNNAVSGVGVMFEGNSEGSRAEYIDAIHMMNGAFSSYSNNVSFDHVRSFDNIAEDQGRGDSMSNALIFASAGDGVHFTNATYTNPGNPNNIAWDEGSDTIQVREDSGATPVDRIQNVFDWTKSGDASAVMVSTRSGEVTSPVPGSPEPDHPTVPSEPPGSELPSDPAEPSLPETPAVPGEPPASELPTDPAEPPTSEIPAEPSEPETPDDPSAPAEPELPDTGASGPNITGNWRSNTLTGTSASEKIYGLGGNDKLFGLEGDDIIKGGSGRDTIDGGAGTDYLWGGKGSDTFVFKAGNGMDYVQDFQARGWSQDYIQIEKSMFADFDTLMQNARSVDGDVWIDSGSDHLVLNDVKLSHLSDHDFLFV